MSIELAVDRLIEGQMVAYFAPTYKDAYNWWQEIKLFAYNLISSKDEQVKQLKTITGGTLDVWSMDDPDSGRGRKYHRVIVDECEKAGRFEEAWLRAIRPTLADFQGDAWFMSTPKFGNTYFKKIAQNSTKFDNWTSWTFTTYDNPHIKKEEVDEARLQLDDLTFRCEYLAEDVDLTNNPYFYAFDQTRHIQPCEFTSDGYLYISFDFNVDPITAIASQYIDGQIRVIKEFRLSNSNIYELCDRITATYPTAVMLVTGDATGHNRSALAVGNINYYTVIKEKLRLSDNQLKVPGVNPALSDSRVLCNSILQNFNFIVDESCKYLIEDLKYVEVNDKGEVDKTKDKHRSHLSDCLRYLLSTFHGKLINIVFSDNDGE
jgi:hypothetical protein